MFKKALQIAVTFSLLLGGYAGYTRLFLIATFVLSEGATKETTPFPEVDAKSARRAAALARESFGPDFWASQENLKLNYNEERQGYIIYAQDYELLNERKQLKLTPFALVWVSADGKSHKTATSDSALIELSQPFGTLKPGAEPSHITHAKLIGNVKFRDDKGTRDDPTDDLRVSQMDQVDYDEATLQITSESDILLEDRNMTMTGVGMMIQLRRKQAYINPNAPPLSGSGGTGFDAEMAFVYKDVHILMRNAGSSGILPGKSKSEKSGNTPLDTRSDGEMKIVLPRPRPPLLVGPPDLNRPPDPTFVRLNINVRVIRGTGTADQADQLNCDTLDLTLLPKPKGIENEEDEYLEESDIPALLAGAFKEPQAQGSSGPGTDLQLQKAIARGDAVWIQSESQGLKARCIELVHEKHFDGSPDSTYLNGGKTRKLSVEKTDYDLKAAPGTVRSVLVMKAVDAMIFDSGSGGATRVIARGPGRADERASLNSPIQRTAFWEDEMDLVTWRDGETAMPTPHVEATKAISDARGPTPAKGSLRRIITLTGVSELIDHGKPTATEPGQTTTLDARKAIVAEFQSKPKLDPKAPDGPTEIQWLVAYKDAHLTAPSKTLTAREVLNTKFENPLPPPAPVAAAGSPGPMVAAGPVATPQPESAPNPDPAPKAPEPAIDGRANRIYAIIVLGSGGTKGELKHAMLRGGVMVHQDPAPGKLLPNEASGEAIDLTGQGQGLMKFAVQREELPQAIDPRTKLASYSNGRRTSIYDMARVTFEGKVIESENLIGLDQKTNLAWSEGPGVYYQMTDRGLLDDQGISTDKARTAPKSGGPTPQDKLVISWNDRMYFYGRSRDLDGRAVAKIEFRGTSRQVQTPNGKTEFRRGVDAKMTESRIVGDMMDVYMDKTIDLSKDTRKKDATKTNEPAEPDPQIAMIDCMGKNIYENKKLKVPGVEVINEKTYPGTRILKEKQRIEGTWVIYDKRTGQFSAEGAGITYLYQRDGKSDVSLPAGTLPPLKLTKVRYNDGMEGRFGVARDQASDRQDREARFYGAAQAANATVVSGLGDIDFDNPKARDYVFLTSDEIRVWSFPPPPGSKEPAKQQLKARGNSVARTIDSTITADRVTYDSSTELLYAYGEDDKEVALFRQESNGQPYSAGRGKMLRFNKKTHASDFKDPQALVFTDLSTGSRPKPFFPDIGGSPAPYEAPKPQRLPFMRSQRSSTERKQFSGQ